MLLCVFGSEHQSCLILTCQRSFKMEKKTRLHVKDSSSCVADLCSELLRLCDVRPDVWNKMNYFRSLYEIVTKIRDLQKGASISRLVLSGDRELRLKALQKRYEECLYFPLSICNCGEAGFGVRADKSIEKNSPLLHIPLRYALSVPNVSSPLPKFLKEDPLFSGMDNVALAIALLHELSLNEKSRWKEYISSLPGVYSTVAYFSDAEFSILDGFPAADAALKAYRNMCRQYAYFYRLFERVEQKDSLPVYMKPFCFEDYQWAISTVMSRNNALPIKGDSDGKLLCLIPLWDMINHKQYQVTTDYDPVSEHIVFYAMESHRQGDEIFMDYGKRTSTEFLLYNGFVPEFNLFHKVPINLGLSKFDKLMQLRTQILKELGLGSEICLAASPQVGTFPPSQLTAFARVFVMNEVELQVTLDELTSLRSGSDVTDRLLSMTLSNGRVDEEAKKFVESRIKLLIRNYESRLEKSLQLVPTASPIREQCLRLCRHDIFTLSQCLAALSEQSR
ncbi:SET domain containing protein 3 [Echinococcus multilocularis]|uniref:protein-histidine N-methyltransferase n=1 Tax=Echinococcus multilocularis TaxID=6211 RepID=A0A068YCA2_ECHMU|nr:SET domain containing protein 3 [Echinococcus multilocularis]